MAGYIGTKASVVTPGAERKKIFAITTTTTSLTGLVYTPGFVHVYHNGVRLVDGTDYTATNGTSITLTVAAQNGDEVVVISFATFQTSDTVSASAGGTFSNAVTIDANGATVLTVDRATSDGTIIDLQKDGTTVGSIGTDATDIYIGTGQTGIRFNDAVNGVLPYNTSTGQTDNTVDLGFSSVRWKDLYLSGGVYVGGTTSANYLDDYEEGTWTPVYQSSGTNPTFTPNLQDGKYTKVGRMVFASFRLRGAITGTKVDNLQIGGLPFTASSSQATGGGPIRFTENFGANMFPSGMGVQPSGTHINLTTHDSDSARGQKFTAVSVSSTSTSSSGNYIIGHIVYDAS